MRITRHALTLLELIIVISIIGILITLLLPAVHSIRGQVMRASCSNNLRQCAIACLSYESTIGFLPQGCSYDSPATYIPGSRYWGSSWLESILPYIEQPALAEANLQAWQEQSNITLVPRLSALSSTLVKQFACPSSNSFFLERFPEKIAITTYIGVAGTGKFSNDGIMHPGLKVRFTDISDGSSNTLMIGERSSSTRSISSWQSLPWCACEIAQISPAGSYTPGYDGCPALSTSFQFGSYHDPCSRYYYWSVHSGGSNFAFSDGSVRFLKYSQSSVIPMLATRAGGEPVTY